MAIIMKPRHKKQHLWHYSVNPVLFPKHFVVYHNISMIMHSNPDSLTYHLREGLKKTHELWLLAQPQGEGSGGGLGAQPFKHNNNHL